MRITTIKATKLDAYGFKWLYKTTHKIFKNKQVAIETIGLKDRPLYRRITNGNSIQEYDRGLFGEWLERKNDNLQRQNILC